MLADNEEGKKKTNIWLSWLRCMGKIIHKQKVNNKHSPFFIFVNK